MKFETLLIGTTHSLANSFYLSIFRCTECPVWEMFQVANKTTTYASHLLQLN